MRSSVAVCSNSSARRARRGRRLQHFLAALRREPVERQDQLGERIQQRQAHQQEAEQDELEERARVIHVRTIGRRGTYNPPDYGIALGAGARDARPARPRRRARDASLALVFAVARNGTIGVDGRLPWRLPEDLKRFRALTTRSRGDHGSQDLGVAAARAAAAAEHRRHARPRVSRRAAPRSRIRSTKRSRA